MIIAVGGRSERHVGLRNRADRAVHDFELDLGGRKARERVGQRLDRALDVALDDDLQFLDLAGLHPLAQILERDAAGLLQLALALLGPAEFGDLARLGFLGHDHERSAGLGHAGESEDFHRRRRRRLGHALAEMIVHRAHAAIGDAANERIALTQRAFLDQHGRDRTAAAIEFRFDHRAARRAIRIGLELHHVGLQQHHLEQLVDTLARARRDAARTIVSPP